MKITVSAKQPDLSEFVGSIYKGDDLCEVKDQVNAILVPSDVGDWPYTRLCSLAADDHILACHQGNIRSIHTLQNIYILVPQSHVDLLLADPKFSPSANLLIG